MAVQDVVQHTHAKHFASRGINPCLPLTKVQHLCTTCLCCYKNPCRYTQRHHAVGISIVHMFGAAAKTTVVPCFCAHSTPTRTPSLLPLYRGPCAEDERPIGALCPLQCHHQGLHCGIIGHTIASCASSSLCRIAQAWRVKDGRYGFFSVWWLSS